MRLHIHLAFNCVDDGYVGKQPVVWKEYCVEYKNLENRFFENIVGKGENAGNQHFLLFRHVLYPVMDKYVTCTTFNLIVIYK